MANETHLLMFYGTECTHCHEMMPLIERLEKEETVHIEQVEVWHNDQNMAKLKKLDDGKCGGVPFFYNEKNNQWVCGNMDYDKLKAWATA